MDSDPKQDIERRFERLCSEAGRRGVIGFAPVKGVRLLPEQAQRLREKLSSVLGKVGSSAAEGADLSAASLGLFYHESEILAVPARWESKTAGSERWNDYARAYQELNRTLDHVSSSLAAEFGGVAEKATIEGWAGKVQHVADYFAHCVSHRAFAEAAGLGWRGRHGLIVTPEVGPALRFATVFVPYPARSPERELAGCGECHACLDVCPVLRKTGDYREACRRRIRALGLAADVCGICVRVCWERVRR